MRVALSLMVVPLAAGLGCVRPPREFKPDGYHDREVPLVVSYSDPASRFFVGPEWRIDNYAMRPDGSIGAPKATDEYRTKVELDVDGDGKPETENRFIYRLRLVNRVTNASMWVETVPLTMQEKDRSLPSFVDDLFDNLSGTGVYGVPRRHPRQVGETKTYGAKVVDSKPGKTGVFESLDATLEVANLDQLKVDPNAKSSIGRVVLVKTDYPHPFYRGAAEYETRLMVVIGCSSNPRDFEATSADFARFLATIDLSPPATRP